MKRMFIISLISSLLFLSACTQNSSTLGANNKFTIQDTLQQVDKETAEVIILLGQSNASGAANTQCFATKYPDFYSSINTSINNVLINYYVNNVVGGKENSSEGAFVSVQFGQGDNSNYFGPEIGIAYSLNNKSTNVFILKYTWSGSVMDTQWMNTKYKRGELYKAALSFISSSMKYLSQKGYNARITAVCWMQGESDSLYEDQALKYFKNTQMFVKYLRKDLSKYDSKDFLFIDSGISNVSYWKYYKTINSAKEKYAQEKENCVYFSTIELGLKTTEEPLDDPDIAHYDSLSMFVLGQKYASFLV